MKTDRKSWYLPKTPIKLFKLWLSTINGSLQENWFLKVFYRFAKSPYFRYGRFNKTPVPFRRSNFASRCATRHYSPACPHSSSLLDFMYSSSTPQFQLNSKIPGTLTSPFSLSLPSSSIMSCTTCAPARKWERLLHRCTLFFLSPPLCFFFISSIYC